MLVNTGPYPNKKILKKLNIKRDSDEFGLRRAPSLRNDFSEKNVIRTPIEEGGKYESCTR